LENKGLYIPVNIKTRYELFEGYGFAELIPTVVTALLSSVFAFLIYSMTAELTLPVLLVLISVALSVIVLTKDQHNLSVVDYTRHVLRFSRAQQRYAYRDGDEWSE
jgi:hypothetical protein